MAVLQITSRQFREKQKSFFDLADSGEKIVIKRGKRQAYVLTPIDDDDLYFSSEMLHKINRSIQQAKNGQVTTFDTEEELVEFLNSL